MYPSGHRKTSWQRDDQEMLKETKEELQNIQGHRSQGTNKEGNGYQQHQITQGHFLAFSKTNPGLKTELHERNRLLWLVVYSRILFRKDLLVTGTFQVEGGDHGSGGSVLDKSTFSRIL